MPTIYTTFIERESCFLKIWGQKEKSVCLYLENALLHMKPQFDAGAGMMSADQLSLGLLCCAKFKDDSYYRARVTNFSMRSQGIVEVLFIDYGNRDLIEINNIRAINNFPASVVSMSEQAKDFILAEVQLYTPCSESVFEVISNELRYLDLEFQYVGQVGPYSLLTLSSEGRNIAETFITRQLALPIEISLQLMRLQNLKINSPVLPFGIPQLQMQTILGQHSSPIQMQSMMTQRSPPLVSPGGQPHFLTYKSLPQKPGTEQAVYVSYVTDGPCMFSIQVQNKEQELQGLMIELNKLPLHPIEENILPGFVCLARSSEDNYICRAVVTSMADSQYKVFFVDFGNTEMRSFDDLFQIPFKYVIPKVMATRFALNGIRGQIVSVDMKVAFKNFVDNQVLRMRVCAPFPNTGISLCDLWNSGGVSALDYVRSASLQGYPDPVVLTRGFNQEVKVSYVFSCVKFHVQLQNKEEELTAMMQKLQKAQMSSITSGLLKKNSPCIALYAADGMYYRAQILSVEADIVTVKYVDYGNEEKIPMKDIRAPMIEFITNLRPQAIECCLNGYQNMANDEERDSLLEELLLEQYFTMKVADVQGSRTLVDLFDAKLYNVASLLLDKVAKIQCKVSPALVQDNKIDHRKTVKTKYPPINKPNALRTDDRSDRPQRNLNNDWRQARENSFDSEGNVFQKNTFNARSSRGDRSSPRENSWSKSENTRSLKTNDWGGGGLNRPDTICHENKRQNNCGGGNGRESRDNTRENSWGDNNKRNNYTTKNDNFFEHSWNGNKKADFNKRPQRDGSSSSLRRRGYRSEDNTSEKSFGSGKSFKGKRDNFSGSPPKKNFEENVGYAEPTEQFASLNVVGTLHKASVSWFYNPANFYLQLINEKAKFDAMMKDIQFAYMKRKSSASAEIGNTVIAQFPEDKGLYRALVLEKPLTGNYRVLYVDFGNMAVTSRIHKVEKRFMELPAQAVQCGLGHVHPVGEQWPKADEFAKFFGEDIMDCQFGTLVGEICTVDITSKGKNLADELHNAGLVKVKNPYEHFDITYLLSQQIYCALDSVRALDDITLQILPGLPVSCALFKLNEAKTPDLERLKSYIGHMIIVYVDEVLDNKIYITLYNTRGQYIPAIELREGIFDAVNPISAALIIGPRLTGFVSHATPSSVFIQTEHSAKQLDILLEQLFAVYETSERMEFEVQEIIYAVKSSDGNWYRGLVERVEGDNITVTFVDYGNQEQVKKAALRILTEDFFMSFCASEITLEDGGSYLEKEIELKIICNDDNWVGEIIKKEEAAPAEEATLTDASPTALVQPVEKVPKVPPTIPEEETQQQPSESSPSPIGFSVELSHFDNPGQFYLQLSSALDNIAQLQEGLQPQAESLADIENITTGILCAAPYSVDQVWYRAQVLDADSDITTVRFIDFGNTDVLGNDIKIKTLPTELLSLEEHAKRCSLHLSPVNGEWTADACKKFENITNQGSLTAEIVHQDEKTTFVRLYVGDVYINDLFTSEGFATELQVPQVAFKGFVSNLNSPSEFWLQYEHACNDLEWIAVQLENADKFKLLEDQAPGSLCAAIFPEDDSWYRARILSNTVAGVEVLFIDYGNSCTCTSLRELPEDLVMVPALAHKCSLLKPQGLLEWSSNATEKFKEVSVDGVTVFTVIKHAQGETNQVQLLLHEEDVSEILKPELCEAKLLSAKSLADFTLRKSVDEVKFMDLQSKIQELVDRPDADEIVVAAQYGSVYYRAKINGSIVEKYVVDLLDLGIEADVTELRQLPKELANIEPLAISVKMNPVIGYTFNAASEAYFKTLCEKDKIFHVEFVSHTVVKLYVDGCDVRENMPATKCTPINSVHSTPKKVKAGNSESRPIESAKNGQMEKVFSVVESILREVINDVAYLKDTTKADETRLSNSEGRENIERDNQEKLNSGIDVEEPRIKEGTEKDEETKSEEEVRKTADMIMSVTDDLVEKVVKQCNLSNSVTFKKVEHDTTAIVNGTHKKIDEVIS